MKKTVISHFYNEEYLLPFWLKHHRGMFDHGILIDYASTDRSRAIIKELTPTWEIVPSRNKYFHGFAIDEEVFYYEAKTEGWKSTLNISEFIFCIDFNGLVADISRPVNNNVNGLFFAPITMVDRPELIGAELDPNFPYVLQRCFGSKGMKNPRGSERLLHRRSKGEYVGAGRHTSSMRNALRIPGLYHMWLGFSPLDEKSIQRKLSFKEKIITEDGTYPRDHATGGAHLVTRDELFRQIGWHQARYCSDLTADPELRKIYDFYIKYYE